MHIESIFKLQKKAIRAVTNSHYLEHTNPLFQNTKLLKLQDINKLQLGCFMYQFHNNHLPKCFENYFIYQNQRHNHNTRTSNNISVETYRTNVKYFSIKVAGPLFWNNLNKNIKESRSIHVFKNSLKKYLTEQLLNIN